MGLLKHPNKFKLNLGGPDEGTQKPQPKRISNGRRPTLKHNCKLGGPNQFLRIYITNITSNKRRHTMGEYGRINIYCLDTRNKTQKHL